jgi:hypothetical protein
MAGLQRGHGSVPPGLFHIDLATGRQGEGRERRESQNQTVHADHSL